MKHPLVLLSLPSQANGNPTNPFEVFAPSKLPLSANKLAIPLIYYLTYSTLFDHSYYINPFYRLHHLPPPKPYSPLKEERWRGTFDKTKNQNLELILRREVLDLRSSHKG